MRTEEICLDYVIRRVSINSSLDSKNYWWPDEPGCSQPVIQVKGGGMTTLAAFDHEATAAMAEAYEKACRSMHDWGQPDAIKKIIAKRIIGLAGKGEYDPDQLCDQALKSLGFSESPRL